MITITLLSSLIGISTTAKSIRCFTKSQSHLSLAAIILLNKGIEMGSRLNNPEPNQAQANPGTVPKRRDR